LFVIPIVTLVAATPAALATAGISTWLRWALGIVRWPVATLLLVSGIGALYRVAPSSRSTTRFFTRGVAVAVLGALFASAAFSLYVANVDRYDASYGSLGTVVVTMLWIYGTTSAILFGAEFDAARNAQAAPPRASS
jgi:membrane protein